MSIVNQEITHDNVQADGRRRVRARFLEDTGDIHTRSWSNVPADFDEQAALIAYVPKLEAQLAERAAEELLRQAADEGYQALSDFLFGMTPATRRSTLSIDATQDVEMMTRYFGYEAP